MRSLRLTPQTMRGATGINRKEHKERKEGAGNQVPASRALNEPVRGRGRNTGVRPGTRYLPVVIGD